MEKRVLEGLLRKALLEEDRDKFFTLLFEKFSKRVIAMSWDYLGATTQQSDCEDILMEVFCKLMKKPLDYFEVERLPEIGGLIKKTTMFIILDRFQDLKKHSTSEIGKDLVEKLENEAWADTQTEYSDYLRFLLEHLSPTKREVFEMRLQGFSHDEIAAFMGITSETSRFHLSSAIKKLKKIIDDATNAGSSET